jgi:GMP synthase-like glutamine amidotransferase
MHQDHVSAPPEGFQVLMGSDICPVQVNLETYSPAALSKHTNLIELGSD